MTKWFKYGLVGILVIGALAVLISGVVMAQDNAFPPPPRPWFGSGRGFEHGIGRGGGLEAVAEALGMTLDELTTQLWGGKTLADLADDKGVDLADLREAVQAARLEQTRQQIEQAVDDGTLTRDQADWLLEGLDNGYGADFGRGITRVFGKGMAGAVGSEAAAGALGMSVDELKTQLWGGKTLADLAEEKSVDLAGVQAAVQAARESAMREGINQAVQDGYITQEHADWLLEGLDKGYSPGRMGGSNFGGVRSECLVNLQACQYIARLYFIPGVDGHFHQLSTLLEPQLDG
ncbi:MAG TPA: hypothetical protein VIS10_16480 [Anaerolineales bacterium]